MLRNSELNESSGCVSINAYFAHLVFPVDSSWMENTRLNDSVQKMVLWTTFALKMGVCQGIKHSQPWVSELLYDSNSLLFLFFTVKMHLILIPVLRKSSLLIFKHSILTNNYLK